MNINTFKITDPCFAVFKNNALGYIAYKVSRENHIPYIIKYEGSQSPIYIIIPLTWDCYEDSKLADTLAYSNWSEWFNGWDNCLCQGTPRNTRWHPSLRMIQRFCRDNNANLLANIPESIEGEVKEMRTKNQIFIVLESGTKLNENYRNNN